MITDTSVFLGAWPFRFLPWEGTRAIQTRLSRNKITVAWVSLFEGIFHKDLAAVNQRLARECAVANEGNAGTRLIPFGVINPKSPDWREDLRRCVELHAMPGVRLFPGAHGYPLDDPELAALLKAVADRNLFAQVVMKIEDERTQHPLVKLSAVELTALPGLVAKIPTLKLQILNMQAGVPDEIVLPLARSGRVWFDFAMVEGVAGVARFAERVGTGQLLFGSYFPLFYAESALLKLVEADLPETDLQAIHFTQANGLVPSR
ncbi:MAG: amidohydrolase family protein [Planctomycetota bacterium]|nr:amidohydrolase family protein [Planctomycetota bacterium]